MSDYLRSIINAFQDLIFIYNEDGVITDYFPPGTGDMPLIPQKEDLLNKHYSEVTPPDIAEKLSNAFAKIRCGDASAQFENNIEIEGRKIWFSMVISRLKFDDQPHYLGVVRDITSRKESESALERSEKKYREIFENARDVIFQLNNEGKIIEVSPMVERYFGYKPEEMIGNTPMPFQYNSEEWTQGFEMLQKHGEIIDFQTLLKDKADHVLYGSINAHASFDDTGNINGIVGFIRDITERKKSEEKIKKANDELQKLNRQKDKIFSVIAHDLKNTVTGPLGLYELIFSDYESLSKKELLEYLKMLRKSTINQSNLLNDLLMWSRNQFKNSSASPERVHLVEIVNTVLKHTETAANEKNISIDNLIKDEIYIYADPDMLKTILRNLVNNAIKFSHTDGAVRLDSQKKKNRLSVSVSDNGVGISDDAIKKIFNKDIHYTTPGTNGEKGSGLGLDLCVDFVEKHNGSIKANSQPGEGTTITFTLPEEELGKNDFP